MEIMRNTDSQKYYIAYVLSEWNTKKMTYEKMERLVTETRCWSRNRLVSLIPEVDDGDSLVDFFLHIHDNYSHV